MIIKIDRQSGQKGFAGVSMGTWLAHQHVVMEDAGGVYANADAYGNFVAAELTNEDHTNPTGSWVYDPYGGAGGSWFK